MPVECGYGTTSILSCSGLGSTPVYKGDCSGSGNGTDVCATGSNGTVCLPQECTCSSKTAACGSSFSDTCKYSKNTVYKCSGKGAAPEVQQDCGSGLCAPTTQDFSTVAAQIFSATDAQCSPPCTCSGNQDICSTILPPECGFNNASLLSCSGFGFRPLFKEDCQHGCVTINGGNRCSSGQATTTGAVGTSTSTGAGTTTKNDATGAETNTAAGTQTNAATAVRKTNIAIIGTELNTAATGTTTETILSRTESTTATTGNTAAGWETNAAISGTSTHFVATETNTGSTGVETNIAAISTETDAAGVSTETTVTSTGENTAATGAESSSDTAGTATALYSCSAIGAPPTETQICVYGCLNTTTPNTCRDCTALATQLSTQLESLVTNLQAISTTTPAAKPVFDESISMIREILAKAPSTSLDDQAAASNEARQINLIISTIYSLVDSNKLRMGVPNPYESLPPYEQQLRPTVENLGVCAGGNQTCDLMTRFINEVVSDVQDQVNSIQSTFPLVFLSGYLHKTLQGGTATVLAGLADKNNLNAQIPPVPGLPISRVFDGAVSNLTSGATTNATIIMSDVEAALALLRNDFIPLAPEPLKSQLNSAIKQLQTILSRNSNGGDCYNTPNACMGMSSVAADVIIYANTVGVANTEFSELHAAPGTDPTNTTLTVLQSTLGTISSCT
ncbi:hypothetical protein BGZ73_004085 [Actinomortierella ambigua]|nr:hypothetical protein BGZ73_004085 [Actinomortierella ambigua]